jgi:glutamine amidotransferase
MSTVPAVALVDYGAGNLTSVSLALSHVGVPHLITRDPDVIRTADRVVFPGVGAAGSSMANIRSAGIDQALLEVARSGKPLLGICIGCQILLESSQEDGGTTCLGLLPGSVKRFDFSALAEPRPKIPHMGWNPAAFVREHPVLSGIPSGASFYFVHSFYPAPALASDVLATTTYGDLEFASILARDNVVATQFHAEKSGVHGLDILKNFASWRP